MFHGHFGVNHAINDVIRSQTNFGGKAILIIVLKKEKSSYLKNRYFFGLELKVDLICHLMSVSNLTFWFVSYFLQINFDKKISKWQARPLI